MHTQTSQTFASNLHAEIIQQHLFPPYHTQTPHVRIGHFIYNSLTKEHFRFHSSCCYTWFSSLYYM